MTLDIAGLTAQLGKKYQDVYDQNLIPYKSKPKNGSLAMRKESLHLYFEPYGVGLSEITLTLFDEKTKQFHFPPRTSFRVTAIYDTRVVTCSLWKTDPLC
ncbi:DUF6392 family protein [Proteus terrae]|uniref:DUF6392 family protein n=1 Tax=Proteus terrae TaxID=1574161 RepID=UPI0032DAA5D0